MVYTDFLLIDIDLALLFANSRSLQIDPQVKDDELRKTRESGADGAIRALLRAVCLSMPELMAVLLLAFLTTMEKGLQVLRVCFF